MLGVALFGLFGAVISAIIKSADSNQSARIPEMVLANRITLLRILLGAGSAIFIYTIITSQLSSLIGISFDFAKEGLSISTVYSVSFLAGFSERLVLSAVTSIIKK